VADKQGAGKSGAEKSRGTADDTKSQGPTNPAVEALEKKANLVAAVGKLLSEATKTSSPCYQLCKRAKHIAEEIRSQLPTNLEEVKSDLCAWVNKVREMEKAEGSTPVRALTATWEAYEKLAEERSAEEEAAAHPIEAIDYLVKG
jgi:hypothetical protein